MCGSNPCPIDVLALKIDELDDDRLFEPGEHIACCADDAWQCVFTQRTTELVSGARVKELFYGIVDHGCTACGSNPFYNNDVDQGELTINYVS